MNLEYFPQFFRYNYPDVDADNESIVEIGVAFKKYLEDKFKDSMDKLEGISDIDPRTVIENQMSPTAFSVNGYHPALVIHFGNFVKEQIKK